MYLLLSLALASLSSIVSAAAQKPTGKPACGRGVINVGAHVSAKSCSRVAYTLPAPDGPGNLYNCGDGTTMMISNTGHVTLRVFKTDSTVRVMCGGEAYLFHCYASNNIGRWVEPMCKQGKVEDVIPMVEWHDPW